MSVPIEREHTEAADRSRVLVASGVPESEHDTAEPRRTRVALRARAVSLSSWARSNRLLAGILAFELLFVLVFGVWTARDFVIYSPVDEGAHFDYVQTVAEDLRLPKLHDRIHQEIASIADGSYPNPPVTPVEKRKGLGARSYEAFQPPLYYIVAAPVFWIPVDNVKKLKLLRGFGLLLLLAALIPLGLLCRDLFGRRWPLALAFSGLVFLLPNVLERAVLISNIALEVPLTTLFIWLVYRAYSRDSLRWLTAAGAVLGLCLLTKLTLVFLVPIFAIALVVHAWRHRTGYHLVRLLAIAALPLLLLAPWFAWNHDTYGTWTANSQAEDMQRHIINPDNVDYHLSQMWDSIPYTIDFSFPQEWGVQAQRSIPTLMRNFLLVALFLLPLVISYACWNRKQLPGALLTALPLLLGLATLMIVTIRTDFIIMLPRYLHAALPAWGVFAFLAWNGAASSERVVRRLSIASLVAITYLWVGYANEFL